MYNLWEETILMSIIIIISSIFAISVCYTLSAIFAKYFFPDDYINLDIGVPVIDQIGKNDILRDIAWTLCVIVGMTVNVAFLHNFTSPLTYTLGCMCFFMYFGSRDQNNAVWETKDKDNIFLSSLPYISAIGYTLLSYLIYLASV